MTSEAETAWKGPLAGSYPAAVALVVCALVPFLAVTSAMTALGPLIGREVGLSRGALELTTGMANAAYATGTVIAVQLAQRLPGRRLLLLYVTLFVVAAALAAWAPTGGVFVGAFVAEGLCTSLMLIAAVPPLVIGWPPEKMPWTGGIMNLCIFGAVAAGPTIGSALVEWHTWRPLFVVVTAIGVVAAVFAVLTFEDQPPQDTDAPWDVVALVLAGGGCAAAFFGASELELHQRASVPALLPLAAGVAAIVALVVHQYREREPLMPVRQLATTLPTIGVLTAVFASAAAFGLMDLTLTVLAVSDPGRTALYFLAEIGAALVTAAVFASLFRTRFVPALAIGGLAVLAVAAAVVAGLTPSTGARIGLGAGLVGLGVGASVSPALFMAGFSLRSEQIQRVFALIELLRGVGAFLFAPILLYVATIVGSTKVDGFHAAAWICLGVAATGFVAAVALFVLGGARLQPPDLDRWEEGEIAWDTPPLLGAVRTPRG
jgi:MFS family permease